jgi:hypothetical protein
MLQSKSSIFDGFFNKIILNFKLFCFTIGAMSHLKKVTPKKT